MFSYSQDERECNLNLTYPPFKAKPATNNRPQFNSTHRATLLVDKCLS
jgi:hypothetical protein